MTLRRTLPVLVLVLLASSCSSASPETDSSPTPMPPVVSEEFCALIAQGRELETSYDLNGLSLQMQLAVEQASSDDDPAAIAAIRKWGEALEGSAAEIVPVYEDLLDLTDDPLLLKGVEFSIEVNRDFTLAIGPGLTQVETLGEFQDIMAEFTNQLVAISQDPDFQESIRYLNDFSVATCGFPLSTNS